MINLVYFNDNIRCYRDGRVERYLYWHKKPFWQIVPNTANHTDGYNQVNVDGKAIFRHRIITFCFIADFDITNPKEMPDHIDGNKLNNAVENLRTCNHAGNGQNRVNVKGYSYHKECGKYRAKIGINGRRIYGKPRETEEEARQDYLDLKKIHHTYFADKESNFLL